MDQPTNPKTAQAEGGQSAPVADPFAHLPALNCTALPSFYPESARVRDAVIGLECDKAAAIQSKSRVLFDAMPATTARATLTRLPGEGESLHIVSRGLWPAFDLIPVAMRLAAPATIDSLHIATLSLSRENVDQMLFLMDAGAIRSVCMVVSCYFRSTEQGIVDRIAREFEAASSASRSAAVTRRSSAWNSLTAAASRLNRRRTSEARATSNNSPSRIVGRYSNFIANG